MSRMTTFSSLKFSVLSHQGPYGRHVRPGARHEFPSSQSANETYNVKRCKHRKLHALSNH
ncbi:hypothetical protein ACU8KH_01740 [Lachancea thermotolerans]